MYLKKTEKIKQGTNDEQLFVKSIHPQFKNPNTFIHSKEAKISKPR